MKISAILSAVAATKVSYTFWKHFLIIKVLRHARSQSSIDEFFNGEQHERLTPDSMNFQLQLFILYYSAHDYELADKLANYGCWCQLNNKLPGRQSSLL